MSILIFLCIVFFILTSILVSICIYLVNKISKPCMTLLSKIVLCIGSVTGKYITDNKVNIFNVDIDELSEKISIYVIDNIPVISNDNMVQESLSNNKENVKMFIKTYLISLISYINENDHSEEFENICSEDCNIEEAEQYDLSYIWDDDKD